MDTGKIRFVYRHFPLTSIHDRAEPAARATECADDQSRFFDYLEEVYANSPNLSDSDLKRYATNVGLDRTTFDACADGTSKAVRVQQDANSGMALGVSSTPTFFVGSEMVVGFQSATQLGQVIDRHLNTGG